MVNKEDKGFLKCDVGLFIIEVLKMYSSDSSFLTLENIKEKIIILYGIEVDCKTISATLKRLLNFDDNIDCDISYLENDNVYYSNWRYNATFSISEIRLLIDFVKSNNCLLLDDKKEFYDKIKSLSESEFLSKLYVDDSKDDVIYEVNSEYFDSIDVITRAIHLDKQISFKMKFFDINLDLVESDKKYIVIPCDLVYKDCVYYLVANFGGDKKYQFRVDKLSDVRIVEYDVIEKSVSYISKNVLDYVESRGLMFSGDVVLIKVIIDKCLVDKFVTEFGNCLEFSELNDNDVLVNLKTNKEAFSVWVRKYLNKVKIIEPNDLKEEINVFLSECVLMNRV